MPPNTPSKPDPDEETSLESQLQLLVVKLFFENNPVIGGALIAADLRKRSYELELPIKSNESSPARHYAFPEYPVTFEEGSIPTTI